MSAPSRTFALPAEGDAITLEDLSEFVAEAYSRGFTGGTPVRFMGVVEFDFRNGPRASRVSVVPGEIPPAELPK